MIDLLGLPSLVVTQISESLASIYLDVELRKPPQCPAHPDVVASRNGKEKPIRNIADAPMRGKAVRLTQHRHQWQCPVCENRLSTRSPDFHPDRAKTHRLIRYVQDAILRRPATDIAHETGMSPKEIRSIADELYGRLKGFRFATPDAIAMDAVHFSRTIIYQVISDARTGHVLGTFRERDADEAAKRLGEIVDIGAVRIFVTDMHETNLAIARTFRGDSPPVHVADKFHVLERCNKAVFSIVGDQIKTLEARGKKRSAKALRAMQPMLAGRRTYAQKKDPSFALDEFTLPKRWTLWASVNAAHQARITLHDFYKCRDRASAMTILAKFRERAAMPLIAERMIDCLGYINNNEVRILNYFDMLESRPDGSIWAPTTNSAERKNGDLQDLWRRSRGFPGADTSNQFWLKAVFHAYKLNRHLVECATCDGFVGPLSDQEAINRASSTKPLPELRCKHCLNEHRRPEPEPETAIIRQSDAA